MCVFYIEIGLDCALRELGHGRDNQNLGGKRRNILPSSERRQQPEHCIAIRCGPFEYSSAGTGSPTPQMV